MRRCSIPSERGQLSSARDWNLLVDIGRQLVFPPEITTTTLRPDIVLWSPSIKKDHIIKLTVPWDNSVDEAYERKYLRYAELAAEAEQYSWNTEVHPVEWRDLGVSYQNRIREKHSVPLGGEEWPLLGPPITSSDS